MKTIYVVLTHTGTVLSRIIRILTNSMYTHASVSFDKNMEYMYSFGRLNPYDPFRGGFVKEGINIGTFKRFKNTEAGVYSLEISDEQYMKLKENILLISDNRKTYKFNILGLIYAFFRKRSIRKNKFYCSEFVRYILETSDIKLEGLSNVFRPEDFKELGLLKLQYRGLLRLYKV